MSEEWDVETMGCRNNGLIPLAKRLTNVLGRLFQCQTRKSVRRLQFPPVLQDSHKLDKQIPAEDIRTTLLTASSEPFKGKNKGNAGVLRELMRSFTRNSPKTISV